jgi:hypothetical protein
LAQLTPHDASTSDDPDMACTGCAQASKRTVELSSFQKPRAEFSIPTTITTTNNASMNCVAHIISLNYGTFATLEQKTVIHST